jgi:hypothetical protein
LASTFIKNDCVKKEVNHKNWIKTDNRLENLEWCTTKENIRHARENWLRKVSSNLHFYKNKKIIKVIQLDYKSNFIKLWGSMNQVEKILKIPHQNISACCNWKLKTAGWYKWEKL